MAVGKDKVRVLLTLPIELKEQLENEAKLDNRSLNGYIVNLILKSNLRCDNNEK